MAEHQFASKGSTQNVYLNFHTISSPIKHANYKSKVEMDILPITCNELEMGRCNIEKVGGIAEFELSLECCDSLLRVTNTDIFYTFDTIQL